MERPLSPPEFVLARSGPDQARRMVPEDVRHFSRSYSAPYAMVTWHHRPVGIDIERVQPLTQEFLASVSTAEERDSMSGADARLLTSFWSSKEALAKGLGDALSYDPRRLTSPLLWPEGICGAWRARELSPVPGFVAWLCWKV